MEKNKIKIIVISLIILSILTSSITIPTSAFKSSFLKTIPLENENIIPTTSYIHGTVRKYPDGTPITNAVVEFRKSISLPWKSTRTDENGEYFIEVRNVLFFPKNYVIWAVSTSLEMLPTYIEVQNRRNFDITKDLWLAPPHYGRIYGYIISKENSPIENATVELLIYPYDTVYEKTTTTSDGYYSFTSLNSDIYKVYVEKTGYRPPYIQPEEIYLGRDGQFNIVFNIQMVKSLFVQRSNHNWIINQIFTIISDIK